MPRALPVLGTLLLWLAQLCVVRQTLHSSLRVNTYHTTTKDLCSTLAHHYDEVLKDVWGPVHHCRV